MNKHLVATAALAIAASGLAYTTAGANASGDARTRRATPRRRVP